MCKCGAKKDDIVYGIVFSDEFESFNSIVALDQKESEKEECHCHNAS